MKDERWDVGTGSTTAHGAATHARRSAMSMVRCAMCATKTDLAGPQASDNKIGGIEDINKFSGIGNMIHGAPCPERVIGSSSIVNPGG